jgi:hypothetical protein
MPSDSSKWIRSLRDNPAGKVVADPEGNRWEWQSNDDTSHQLRKLENHELAIEKTDLHPRLERTAGRASAEAAENPRSAAPTARRPRKPGGRDPGGGFNPYDHPGKPKRR